MCAVDAFDIAFVLLVSVIDAAVFVAVFLSVSFLGDHVAVLIPIAFVVGPVCCCCCSLCCS